MVMKNKGLRLIAFIFLIQLAIQLAFPIIVRSQETEPIQYQTFRKMMREADVPEAETQTFFDALEEMEEIGDVSALQPFLNSKHEPIAMVAGCAFAVSAPKQTRKTLHRELQKTKTIPSRAVLLTGSMVASRKTIDLLLARLNEDDQTDVNFALTVATGQLPCHSAPYQ